MLVALGYSLPCHLWAAGVDGSWIRLRLHENLKKISIQGTKIDLFEKKDSFRNVSIGSSAIQVLSIEWQRKWNQSFLLITREDQIAKFRNGSIFLKGNEMKIGSKSAPSFVQIYKHSSGFDVIAYIKMRDYLKGVVSAEMPVNWPKETLKAQIVAARSYALYMADQRRKLVFDLEASTKDQAFQYESQPMLDPLINETADLVLLDQKKNMFKTYYHSECGGQTSSAKKVFGDSNFDVEVKDPYCRDHSWSLSLSRQELEKYFGRFKAILNTFDPLKRAYSISVRRLDESIEAIDAQKLRMAMGPTRLKSTWFEMRQSENMIEFKGKGYGHGVGLCQWGSRQMGLMKKSFREILEFYYPGSILRAVKSDRLYF